MRCLLLLALATLALAQTPTRPKIAETFESIHTVTVRGREGVVNGTGRWYSDAVSQKEMESSELDGGKFRVYRLARFDLKKEYSIMGNDTHCEVNPLGEFRPPFGWLLEATFEGTHTTPTGVKVDVWSARHDEFAFTLGVMADDTSKPVFFEREEGHTVIGYVFKSFLATTPPSTSFNVPPSCNQ